MVLLEPHESAKENSMQVQNTSSAPAAAISVASVRLREDERAAGGALKDPEETPARQEEQEDAAVEQKANPTDDMSVAVQSVEAATAVAEDGAGDQKEIQLARKEEGQDVRKVEEVAVVGQSGKQSEEERSDAEPRDDDVIIDGAIALECTIQGSQVGVTESQVGLAVELQTQSGNQEVKVGVVILEDATQERTVAMEQHKQLGRDPHIAEMKVALALHEVLTQTDEPAAAGDQPVVEMDATGIAEDTQAMRAVMSTAIVDVQAPAADAILYEDNASEQWFVDADVDDDDNDALIPVNTENPSGDDDDEPVFLGTSSASETFQLERNGVAKRKRPSDGDDSDATLVLDSGDDSSSSSSSSSNSSNSSSGSSESSSSSSGSDDSASESEDEKSKSRAKTAKKARHDVAMREPLHLIANPKKPRVVAPRTIPPEYKVFDNMDPGDREFPILRGSYVIKSNHRAVFSGHWGFCDADFAAGGALVSKFEYTSIYLHGRQDSDRRPFSGKYGGYFNFRQFSGKIVKIREDQVELNFIKMPREDKGGDDVDDDNSDEDAEAFAKYEVFGRGKNKFGRFLIRGYLSPATGKLSVRRRYLD